MIYSRGIENMFDDYIRRKYMRRLLKAIESYASSRNRWGNNNSTVLAFLKIISKHSSLFTGAVRRLEKTTIEGCFKTTEEMVNWLQAVESYCQYIAEGNDVPDTMNTLFYPATSKVKFFNLINGEVDGELNKVIGTLLRHCESIHNHYKHISPSDKDFLQFRLALGYNSIAAMCETILEEALDE